MSTLAVSQQARLPTSCTGLAPVMAAEQFLPPGKLETVSRGEQVTRLFTSRAGLSPVMAAEEFLPSGKLEVVSVVDTTWQICLVGFTQLRTC